MYNLVTVVAALVTVVVGDGDGDCAVEPAIGVDDDCVGPGEGVCLGTGVGVCFGTGVNDGVCFGTGVNDGVCFGVCFGTGVEAGDVGDDDISKVISLPNAS